MTPALIAIPWKKLCTGHSHSTGWNFTSKLTSRFILLQMMLQTTLDTSWRPIYTLREPSNHSFLMIDGQHSHSTIVSMALWNALSNQVWPIPLPGGYQASPTNSPTVTSDFCSGPITITCSSTHIPLPGNYQESIRLTGSQQPPSGMPARDKALTITANPVFTPFALQPLHFPNPSHNSQALCVHGKNNL